MKQDVDIVSESILIYLFVGINGHSLHDFDYLNSARLKARFRGGRQGLLLSASLHSLVSLWVVASHHRQI